MGHLRCRTPVSSKRPVYRTIRKNGTVAAATKLAVSFCCDLNGCATMQTPRKTCGNGHTQSSVPKPHKQNRPTNLSIRVECPYVSEEPYTFSNADRSLRKAVVLATSSPSCCTVVSEHHIILTNFTTSPSLIEVQYAAGSYNGYPSWHTDFCSNSYSCNARWRYVTWTSWTQNFLNLFRLACSHSHKSVKFSQTQILPNVALYV